jgi:hypothetical protein
MAARNRLLRRRIVDMPRDEYAAYQARRSARLARAGLFGAPQPAADDYARRREEDADLIERVYTRDREADR